MPTRRLSFSPNLKPQAVPQPDGSEPVHVEVPAGESWFRISWVEGGPEDAQYVFHLRHPESRLLLTGTVETAGESAPRLCTAVVHHAPRTRAETAIKTLAADAAYPHYEGLISIEEGANGSESYLNHHSLLLGTTAKSWTLPSLEIKADDVKCSHAATLRTITDLDLFYLRSRGLDVEASRAVLTHAFLRL